VAWCLHAGACCRHECAPSPRHHLQAHDVFLRVSGECLHACGDSHSAITQEYTHTNLCVGLLLICRLSCRLGAAAYVDVYLWHTCQGVQVRRKYWHTACMQHCSRSLSPPACTCRTTILACCCVMHAPSPLNCYEPRAPHTDPVNLLIVLQYLQC
jgi:hypothetical protein